MKLTAEQLEILTDALDRTGVELRPYSGRGMFGDSCLGIVPNTDTARFFMFLAQVLIGDGQEEILDLLIGSPSREDSLGKNTIVYFPNLLVDDEDADEDEDELV